MTRLFTLFVALVASITFASATIIKSVLIDGLCYDLDDATRNDQLFIEKNGKMYNAQGAEMR